ncbi:hypothetical protein E3O19_16130 [Cryobacterium algoritolerans]|uniref:Uncharacterized protein n=1 Tax=Cryobacterium algoritolerans TaxID=1259184 RepID=A0A4R8WKD8_9MICO|nr:SIR2 family protein [Cryobacterium algoritolerans]TFC09870.1 hypothetical protein E3O19_16130 [Cryobacterium algoritolerans]
MTFSEELAGHLGKFSTAPFLFIGSGFSRRFVGSEDWNGLLGVFADKTQSSIARYSASANGDPAAIASLIAEDFHEIWWDDAQYAPSRAKYPNPKTRESALKIEVAEHFSKAVDRLPTDGPQALELGALKAAVLEGVITTNYDSVLESVFPDFEVFVGQDELLFRNPQGVAEIYKIHGSCEAPESLVLTTADYDRFRARNPYLAAKLLTVFVEHPIIFIGYSLNDSNIREILVSIATVLTTDNLDELRDRLIFVQWDPSVSKATLTTGTFAADGMPIPLQIVTVPDYMELFTVLGQLKRRFPARILRHLKEHVYNLVLTSETTNTVYVSNLSGDEDASSVDVVIGVGAIQQFSTQGIVGLTRQDIALDVLTPSLNEKDFGLIVDRVLPRMLGGGRNHTPIFRFLRGAGRLTDAGEIIDPDTIDASIKVRASLGLDAWRPSTGYFETKAKRLVAEHKTIEKLIEVCNLDDVLYAIPSLAPENVNQLVLHDFLLEKSALLDNGSVSESTQWSKSVCFYDYLVNRTRP